VNEYFSENYSMSNLIFKTRCIFFLAFLKEKERERKKERAETATVAAYSCPYNASWLQLSPAVLTDAQLKLN